MALGFTFAQHMAEESFQPWNPRPADSSVQTWGESVLLA